MPYRTAPPDPIERPVPSSTLMRRAMRAACLWYVTAARQELKKFALAVLFLLGGMTLVHGGGNLPAVAKQTRAPQGRASKTGYTPVEKT